MSRVLVTGGAGFIGSWLCERLLARDHTVSVIDNLATGSLSNLASVLDHTRFTFVHGDVRDPAVVDDLVSHHDAVVHLAARIGLQLVVESPLETLEANVRGTQVVLDAAVRTGARTVVASSSEVYGLSNKYPSAESDPITIGSPTRGRWSYACSKAYDEFITLALHRERGLPATVVRFFNTVGPRQSGRYGMVLPRFVSQALAGEPLTVHGDGSQTRCFCHVSDVLDALQVLIEDSTGVGEVFNIGNPEEIAILALAEKVIARTGSSSSIAFVPYADVFGEGFEEIQRRVPDITKARSTLGFEPWMPLEAAIDGIVRAIGVGTGAQRRGVQTCRV